MRAHVFNFLSEVRASYWFWPSLMSICSIILSVVTVAIDANISSDWPEKIPFIYSNQADGARALLATVAGSMITVTGITFSLTLLAVSHATSQFGPRLLTNFMKDRGNQITLGTFISTFLYCLMVLRTVRSAEEATGSPGEIAGDMLGAFVPHLSIFTALVMTLFSVGILIYYIHHIPESMRLSNVVGAIGKELLSSISNHFPESTARNQRQESSESPLPELYPSEAVVIHCKHHGYLQAVDEIGLLNTAKDNDIILEMCVKPGDFISAGQPLVKVFPPQQISDEAKYNLQFMFVQGAHRTSQQNPLFLVDQLVEVSARALSPGVNDPMSAITCIDWLQSALLQLCQRDDPELLRYDNDDHLRMIERKTDFKEFSSRVYDQLRPYVATDRNAAIRMMTMTATVLSSQMDSNRRLILVGHANDLLHAAEKENMFSKDLDELRRIHARCTISQS